MTRSLADATAFFSLDAVSGALVDANGDGVPDGIRARLVLTGQPSAAEWVELVNLAARIGLETTGIALPLVSANVRSIDAGLLPVYFVPEVGGTAPDADVGLCIRGAAEVRRLWQSGVQPSKPVASSGERSACDVEAVDDLAQLFEIGGLYADDDDDLFPDGVAVTVILPEELSLDLGAALCDFAARIGLETTGIRFPLAVAAGNDTGATPAIVLDIAGGADADTVVTWERHHDGRRVLAIRGGERRAVAALRGLAENWPCLAAWDPEGETVSDVMEELTAALAAESIEGRAALVAGAIDQLGQSGRAGEVRLLVDDQLVVEAAGKAARSASDLRVTVAPDDRLVLDLAWEAPWEADRARAAFAVAVAALEPGTPADLLVLVSEPDAVRAALAVEFGSQLPPGSVVRVLSAFKAGLSWLREVVAPAWSALPELARVEVHYRRFTAVDGADHLDLPIRWLQELFPGDELIAPVLGLSTDAIQFVEAGGGQTETYVALAYDARGAEVARAGFSPRWYARPYLEQFPARGVVAASTGYIRLAQGERLRHEESLPTDYDRFWDFYQGAVLPSLASYIAGQAATPGAGGHQPFFDALDVEVWASEPEERLGVREEALSSSEALHEDIYFATLDFIATLGGGERGSGTFDPGRPASAYDAPGAVRPWLHVVDAGAPHARVRLRAPLSCLAEFVPDEATSGAGSEPLASLPAGPRPRASVLEAHWRSEHSTPTRLVVQVNAAGATATTLRAFARLGEGASAHMPLVVRCEGAGTVSLDWPLTAPVSGRGAEVRPAGPIPLDQIVRESELEGWLGYLRGLPGVFARRVGRSYGGRALDALVAIAPPGPGVWSRAKLSLWKPTALFIARHHANEVASTPAALRLVELLASDPGMRPLLDRVNVVVLPFENADGAALHAALCEEHPYWKHHAARFNAVGLEFSRDFFNPATRYGESRGRPALWRAWRPDLVTDNHGIPSHEWVQLFSGFNSPPRFGVSYWLVQAHLYGILRYPAGSVRHREFATTLRDRVAAAVAGDECLTAAARPFRDRYDSWGARRLPEKFPAEYVHGMFWFFQARLPGPVNPHQPPHYDRVTSANWVTEVADETVRDEFLGGVAWGHLVANRAALELLAEVAPGVERAVKWDAGGLAMRLHRQRPLPAAMTDPTA